MSYSQNLPALRTRFHTRPLASKKNVDGAPARASGEQGISQDEGPVGPGTGAWREITFPEKVYAASPGGTPEFDTRMYRVRYESMVTSPSIYDYDLETRRRTLLKQEEVLGGYNPRMYETKRLWARARDGARVPISIVKATENTEILLPRIHTKIGEIRGKCFSLSRVLHARFRGKIFH